MFRSPCVFALCAFFTMVSALGAQHGTVLSVQKISDLQGSFNGFLENADHFGTMVAAVGDIDGDGNQDLAVSAILDDDGGSNRGAVYILFLNPNGTVRNHQKISDIAGGFSAVLNDEDQFGGGVAGLGDLDGDTVPDLAVSAAGDNDGGADTGAVYVLLLNSDGTVKSHQKIGSTSGNFGGTLTAGDQFGTTIAGLGDLDGDDVVDLAIGAAGDSENGNNRGAVWIVFLNVDGTAKSQQKINDTKGGFSGILDDDDFFAYVGVPGDVDDDDVPDLVVGATGDDDGGVNRGAAWVLFLNSNGTVKTHQKISSTAGGFTGVLDDGDIFAYPAGLGDIDGDGVSDIAVGAPLDDDGDVQRGAVWILFLNTDGTVKGHQKISGTSGNLNQDTGYLAQFGRSVALLPDLNGDFISDLVVGAPRDDDGGSDINADRGAVYVFNIDGAVDLQGLISENLNTVHLLNGFAMTHMNTAKRIAEHIDSQIQTLIDQTTNPVRRSELEEALCRMPQVVELTQSSIGRSQDAVRMNNFARLIVDEQDVSQCIQNSAAVSIADLNGDGVVNYDDLAMFTTAWMAEVADPNSP